MFYVVDGTGSVDAKVYNHDMRDGMCDRIRRKFGAKYYIGPTTFDFTKTEFKYMKAASHVAAMNPVTAVLGILGTMVLSNVEAPRSTKEIAETVFRDILKDPRLGKEPLYLAGHSRGGAAVIAVARLLEGRQHKVKAMFLFDAVDKSLSLEQNVETIPPNVEMVFHALREKGLENEFSGQAADAKKEYDSVIQQFAVRNMHRSYGPIVFPTVNGQQIDLNDINRLREERDHYRKLDDAMKVRMRNTNGLTGDLGVVVDFENCGTAAENPRFTQYYSRTFHGSHGAIGVSPIGAQDEAWKTAEDKTLYDVIIRMDQDAVAAVWAWMEKFCFVAAGLTPGTA